MGPGPGGTGCPPVPATRPGLVAPERWSGRAGRRKWSCTMMPNAMMTAMHRRPLRELAWSASERLEGELAKRTSSACTAEPKSWQHRACPTPSGDRESVNDLQQRSAELLFRRAGPGGSPGALRCRSARLGDEQHAVHHEAGTALHGCRPRPRRSHRCSQPTWRGRRQWSGKAVGGGSLCRHGHELPPPPAARTLQYHATCCAIRYT